MDFIDYREKLGIGFCDERKYQLFLTKVFNMLNYFSYEKSCPVYLNEYMDFCSDTGSKIDTSISAHCDGHARFNHIISILAAHVDNLQEFLSYYVWFINSIDTERETGLVRFDHAFFLSKALNESHIPFELIEEDSKFFVFPKGAVELDKALVSDVLSWLQNYPKTHKTYSIALKQYADGIYIRDTADNFRKALEEFCQEFLGNNKNLDNNIPEVFKYMGANNVEPEVASLMKSLMSTYNTLNNKVAKHNDKIDEKLLEFLMYQTGIFIRMLIIVNRYENCLQTQTN